MSTNHRYARPADLASSGGSGQSGGRHQSVGVNDALKFLADIPWEGLLMRYRLSFIIMAVYAAGMFMVWERAPAFQEAPPDALQPTRDVPFAEAIEPLTRASVLARASVRPQSSTSRQKRPVLVRRDMAPELSASESAQAPLEDAVDILEQALVLASPTEVAQNSSVGARSGGARRAELFGALGGVHGARSQLGRAAGALGRAVVEAVDIGDVSAIAYRRLQLGLAQLHRHRYQAAEEQFLEALSCRALVEDEAVAAHCGAGWAAAMQGEDEKAEGYFLAALAGDGNRSYLPEYCGARDDGLDSYRSLALAGLSLTATRGRARGSEILDQSDLAECASRVLRHAQVPGLGDPAAKQQARNAVGLAHLALGATGVARQQYLWELRQPRCRASKPQSPQSAQALRHDFCPHDPELSNPCPDSVLHLALVDFAVGDNASGLAEINQLVDEVAGASASMAAEWMLRFAIAHLRWPGGPSFASTLLLHVASWLPEARAPEMPSEGSSGTRSTPTPQPPALQQAVLGKGSDEVEAASLWHLLAAQLGDRAIQEIGLP